MLKCIIKEYMKKFKIFIILIIALLNLSCSQDKKNAHKVELVKNEQISYEYEIDTDTYYRFNCLFTHTDSEGNNYLVFLGSRANKIFFYQLESGKLQFVVNLEKEGQNEVGSVAGFHIQDFDNIFLTSNKMGITKVDTAGHKKQFIEYGTTNKGTLVAENFHSSSVLYTPLVINGDDLYITQFAYRGVPPSQTPVSIKIDTINDKFEELPFYLSEVIEDKLFLKYYFTDYFSRDFNGEQFVYAFPNDENIYVTSLDHKDVKSYPAKSQYFNKVKYISADIGDAKILQKQMLENPRYGNLVYDKYRNVYYRIAYPETDLSKYPNYDVKNFGDSGMINFSIIILDENFNVMGETLFPSGIYMSTVLFINEKGLCISDSHILNPDFDEDKLSFKCFELKEIQ